MCNVPNTEKGSIAPPIDHAGLLSSASRGGDEIGVLLFENGLSDPPPPTKVTSHSRVMIGKPRPRLQTSVTWVPGPQRKKKELNRSLPPSDPPYFESIPNYGHLNRSPVPAMPNTHKIFRIGIRHSIRM